MSTPPPLPAPFPACLPLTCRRAKLLYHWKWARTQRFYPKEEFKIFETAPAVPRPPLMTVRPCLAYSRSMPPYDVEGDAELKVVDVTLVGEWTHVTFARLGSGDDDSVSVHREF